MEAKDVSDIAFEPEFYVFLEDGIIKETWARPQAAARVAAIHLKAGRRVGFGSNGEGKKRLILQQQFLYALEEFLV
jgi:hypothetical protein